MEMVNRGATRPMMEDKKSRQEMLRQHHEKTLWIYWTIILLGLWLIMTPLTFNYDVGVVEPSGGREIWLDLSQRIQFMKWSDFLSGILLVILGFRSLKSDHPVSLWAACFVGVWLNFAPILFWAPTAVSYYNDTFVGTWIMALTVIIPGMPNMIKYMEMGTSLPKGWSYNPSTWSQRWIMIVLAFIGWIVSRYLSAYQLGFMDEVWDPFFGDGTRKVLDSSMSHSLPISDAGLGGLAYTIEFLMGFMGSQARWRTMPWMVTLFGILVIPLGLVHIFLVISQPVTVGYWCTFCLLAAAVMIPMIPLQVDEVIAMGQFMKRKVKDGEGFWKVFWKGGGETQDDQEEKESEAPDLYSFPDSSLKIVKASLWGMTFPMTLVIGILLGITITFLPAMFEGEKTQNDILQVSGLLIITMSIIAMGTPIRILRFLNIPLGILVAASGFIFGNVGVLTWCSLVLGFGLVLLSFPKGPKKQSFGGWDKYIK